MPFSSGPTIVCNSSTRFQLNNLPDGYTVSWSYSENLVPAPVLNKCTTPCIHLQAANASTGAPGWVQATISGGTCGDVVLPPHDVWVGKPSEPSHITGFHNNGIEFGSNSYYEFFVFPPLIQGVNHYEWHVGGGTILGGQGTHGITVLTGSGSDDLPLNFNVSVRTGNTCGMGPWLYRSGYVVGGVGPVKKITQQKDEMKLTISPNPASSNITVKEVNPSNDNTPWQLRLMNQQGTILVETTSSLPASISLHGLLPGAYVLHAIQGQYVEQQVVLVK